MIVILIIFLLIIIVFLIYWRFRRDSLMHVQLENELKNYLTLQKMESVRCSVKIYEPDTILAFPLTRKIFFLEEGILIFDKKSNDIGNKAISVWLYYKKEDEFYFKNCQSRGIINKVSYERGEIILNVMQKLNYIPFYISICEMKYEMIINLNNIPNSIRKYLEE